MFGQKTVISGFVFTAVNAGIECRNCPQENLNGVESCSAPCNYQKDRGESQKFGGFKKLI